MNKARVSKLAWMVVSKRNNFCMSVLKCKYKVRSEWLRKDPPKKVSPIWKAIEKSKALISKGACYLVDDRASINVWLDPWLSSLIEFKPKSKSTDTLQN